MSFVFQLGDPISGQNVNLSSITTVKNSQYKLVGRNSKDYFTNKIITDSSNKVAANSVVVGDTQLSFIGVPTDNQTVKYSDTSKALTFGSTLSSGSAVPVVSGSGAVSFATSNYIVVDNISHYKATFLFEPTFLGFVNITLPFAIFTPSPPAFIGTVQLYNPTTGAFITSSKVTGVLPNIAQFEYTQLVNFVAVVDLLYGVAV